MRLLSALLFLILAAPAARAWDEAPRYYRVTGVAAGDVLNIRAEPDAAADIIGTLPPGAGPVEVPLTDASGSWGRVSYFGEAGWVSMRFLEVMEPEMIEGTRLPVGLFCGGTEPFWGLTLRDSSTAVWFDPVAEDPEKLETDMAINFLAGAAARIGLPAALEASAAEATLTATIGPGECSDGMSDTVYPYVTIVLYRGTYGPTVYEGCCALRLPE